MKVNLEIMEDQELRGAVRELVTNEVHAIVKKELTTIIEKEVRRVCVDIVKGTIEKVSSEVIHTVLPTGLSAQRDYVDGIVKKQIDEIITTTAISKINPLVEKTINSDFVRRVAMEEVTRIFQRLEALTGNLKEETNETKD